MSNNIELREQLQKLQGRIEEKDRYIISLEKSVRELEQRLKNTPEAKAPAPIMELEETLKRLVSRIAAILQAEKCVFMLHDKEQGALVATKPALGLSDEEIEALKVPVDAGVSGLVFRETTPFIVHGKENGGHILSEYISLLNIRNAACVPLIDEKRDEEGRVVERNTMGVLHVINKRYGDAFTDEDIQLLERLARNTSAVILNANLYREVLEEKQDIEHIIENAYAGLMTVSKTGRIMQMNALAREVAGIRESDASGKPYFGTIKNSAITDMITRAIRNNEESGGEVSILLSGNKEERIFQAQTAIVRGEDRRTVGTVLILNDITEIRSVERMKTAFVSTVSHELRTPLTSIKGFISTLLDDNEGYYDKATQQEFYEIIDTECDRLTRLITDLLSVSRIEAGRALDLKLAMVHMPEIVEKVVKTQRALSDKHTFKVELDEMPKVIADPDKLDQILNNLLTNAVKYSPDGGQITIKAHQTESGIEISVTDEGMGIPKDHLPKIFERFHRVDNRDTRRVGGTGIGLYLVKHLTQAHGGTVRVESELGKGSTFTIFLPREPVKEEQKV
ncbi:MAG: ATP-binding protein [Armatimonadota bacterium]|jgi:PAS domain S-box-containing protein